MLESTQPPSNASQLFFLKEIRDYKTQETYFVATQLRLSEHAPEEISTANVTVISPNGCWSYADLEEDSLGTTLPNAMRRTLEALTDYLPATEPFHVVFKPNEDGSLLQVEITADQSKHGKDVVHKLHFEAQKVDQNSVTSVFDEFLNAYGSLSNEAEQIEQRHSEMVKSLEQQQQQIGAYANEKQQQYRDSVVQVSALVLEKRKEIEKLRNRLQTS